MHDYYCAIIPRDPRWNPGHIECPDYEKRNCEGCIIKDNQDRENMAKARNKGGRE